MRLWDSMPFFALYLSTSAFFIWHVSTWLPDSLFCPRSETAVSSLPRKNLLILSQWWDIRSGWLATRSFREECPDDVHPSTNINEDEIRWVLRGKAILENAKPKKKKGGGGLLPHQLYGPQKRRRYLHWNARRRVIVTWMRWLWQTTCWFNKGCSSWWCEPGP